MKQKQTLIGSLCIILSAIFFGLMPLITTIAYQNGSNPFTAAFGRFLFGSLLILGILIVMKRSVRVPISDLFRILILSVPYCLTPVLLYSSYRFISSGLATTLHFTYPVVVILFLAVFFRERPTLHQMICAALCTLGLFQLYTPGGNNSLGGIFLAALSGVVYSVYIVLLGKNHFSQMDPMVLSFWLSVFATLEMTLFAIPFGLITFSLTPMGWAAEILLALLASVCALVLFQKGVFLCGEVTSSLLSTFEPLTGIFVGLVFMHETITFKETLGVVLILLSVVLLVCHKKGK